MLNFRCSKGMAPPPRVIEAMISDLFVVAKEHLQFLLRNDAPVHFETLAF